MNIRNDRDMLNYLHQAFETEEHVCDKCHASDPARNTDSAMFLREYLAATPASGEAGAQPIGKVLSEEEMGIGYDRRIGPVIWFGTPKPGLIYAAPIAADHSGKAGEMAGEVSAETRKRAFDVWLDMERKRRPFGVNIEEQRGFCSGFAAAYALHERALLATPAAASERKRERYTGDPQVEWDEFWKEIVAPGGVLDVEQVKKELADFSMLLHFVPKVYDYATGGAVTYPQTLPSAVCSAIDSHIQDLTEEARKEGAEESTPPAAGADDARDAARYRWLESRCENGIGLKNVGGSATQDVVQTWFVRFPVVESGVGMSLSNAIDAALRAGSQGETR